MHADAYPHPVEHIELVETPLPWVLLTGMFAYKIKRPVRYDFIDLQAFDRRAFYCSEEVRLNRRFAPELYLEVSEIRKSAHGLSIGGEGGRSRNVRPHAAVSLGPTARSIDRGEPIQPDALDAFGRTLAASTRSSR